MVGVLSISAPTATTTTTTTTTSTASTFLNKDKIKEGESSSSSSVSSSTSPRNNNIDDKAVENDKNNDDNDNNNSINISDNDKELEKPSDNNNVSSEETELIQSKNNVSTTAPKEKLSGCSTDETYSTDMSASSPSSEVNMDMNTEAIKDNTATTTNIDTTDQTDLMDNKITASDMLNITTGEVEDADVNDNSQSIATACASSTSPTNSLKVTIPSDGIVISDTILNISEHQQQHQQPQSFQEYEKKYTKATTRSSSSLSKQQQEEQQPSTPLGQVVESGQEHTGRWTRDEHQAFLIALKKYGKEWKKVAAKVKTRTVVQTRTHAQKYFQKLQKQLNSKGGGSAGTTSTSLSQVDAAMMNLIQGNKEDGNSDESSSSLQDVILNKKANSRTRRRTSNQPPKISSPSSLSLLDNPTITASTSASLLDIKKGNIINNYSASDRIIQSNNNCTLDTTLIMPSTSAPSLEQYDIDSGSSVNDTSSMNRRNISLTILDQPCPIAQAAAELMSKLASATVDLDLDLFPPTTANANTSIVEPSQIPSQIPSIGQQHLEPSSSSIIPDNNNNETSKEEPSIRIFNPSQFRTSNKRSFNKYFPEPSPAACGKRKLDELTAAQMLADVMMSNSNSATNNTTTAANIYLPPTNSSNDNIIVPINTNTADNKDSMSIPFVDQKEWLNNDAMNSITAVQTISNETNAATTATTDITTSTNDSDTTTATTTKTNSLSIINPDSLGVDIIQKEKISKVTNDVSPPSTPWDGQLEALLKLQKQMKSNKEDKESSNNTTIPNEDITKSNNKPRNEEEKLISSFLFHPIHNNYTKQDQLVTSLHKEIYTSSITDITSILSSCNDNDEITSKLINQQDSLGFTPLHVAACLQDHTIASDITRLLLSYNNNNVTIDPTIVDICGNTALHWASYNGNDKVVHLLSLRNCPLDKQNNDGETALHWAMRVGYKGIKAVNVLLDHGARPFLFNYLYKRPIDVAAFGFHFLNRKILQSLQTSTTTTATGCGKTKCLLLDYNQEMSVDSTTAITIPNLEEIQKTRWNLLSCSPQSRTLVLHHPECLEHKPKTNRDWEVPDRVIQILNRITPKEEDNDNKNGKLNFHTREITISQDFDRASLELLSRVHSTEYLAFVNDLSKELEKRSSNCKDCQCSANNNQNSSSNDDTKNDTIPSDETTATTTAGGGDGDSSPLLKENDNCSVVPFTPVVQRKIRKDIIIKQGMDSDTSFSVGSLRAARRAAGAVQHAVDCVLMGRNRNAFCVVRPPGHHAGYEGLLENGESCGFCIFNNVAAGAAHALSERHRPRCERAAIVDIDVHHGNGTQEIVQRFHDPSRLFFFSVHLYDRDCPPPATAKKGSSTSALSSTSCKYSSSCPNDDNCIWKFYPGTGDTDDVAFNVINAPIAPLWKEKDMQEALKLKSSSSNTVGNNAKNDTSPIHHNTRNRHKRKAAAIVTAKVTTNNNQDSPDVLSQTSSSDSPIPDNNKSDHINISTIPLPPQPPPSPTTNSKTTPYLMGIGRKAYRRAIQHRLLPALRAFNPDLILISAGFDAAGGDVGNAKHLATGANREKVGMDLDPIDYAWTTQKILEVADICCQGRVVSVLEGGYGNESSSDNSNKNSNNKNKDQDVLLDKTVFTECVAQHLWSFVDPYNVEKRCG